MQRVGSFLYQPSISIHGEAYVKIFLSKFFSLYKIVKSRNKIANFSQYDSQTLHEALGSFEVFALEVATWAAYWMQVQTFYIKPTSTEKALVNATGCGVLTKRTKKGA